MTLQEGDGEDDMADIWQACQDRVSVKSISADDNGNVSLSWQSTGDDGIGLLDDIWETKMVGAFAKGSNKRIKSIENEDEEPKKRLRTSSAMTSSGETQKPSKVRGGNSAAEKRTTVASLIRSLNGFDSLLLECHQHLKMFEEAETFNAVAAASISKLLDKLEGKLTQSSIEALTQGWEPGQPENRGCELVQKMKAMVASLSLGKNLAQCLQAKPGAED